MLYVRKFELKIQCYQALICIYPSFIAHQFEWTQWNRDSSAGILYYAILMSQIVIWIACGKLIRMFCSDILIINQFHGICANPQTISSFKTCRFVISSQSCDVLKIEIHSKIAFRKRHFIQLAFLLMEIIWYGKYTWIVCPSMEQNQGRCQRL